MFKFGKKLGKKAVAAVIAYSIVFGSLALNPAERKGRVFAATNVLDYDSASSVNYNTILGRATDYGLLVGTMNQTGHMETTYATNKYIGSTNNDVDLAGEAPSSIIIASVEEGSHPVFGKTRSSVFNIYTTEAIAKTIEFDDQFMSGAAAFSGQTPPSYTGSPSVNFHYQSEDDLKENVNKMLKHTQEQSEMLAKKPSVDVETVLKGSVLDLSSEEYKGATIYVDVPAGSTIETLLQGADALTIKKYPSTNVVFNMKGKNLAINKFQVEVLNDDGSTKKKITSGDQQHSGNYSDHDADIEEYICKNIIFNAPNATSATVKNTAGLFLFPKEADIIVNAAGGWLATPGKVTTEGEWHYFYQGRSKDINTSEKASFHFAAYKAFTTEFKGENTERLSNIYAGKDDFSFSFTETKSDYDTTGLTGTTVKTDANGYLFFPSLSFNIADVDPLNPQYHYYVIKETAVSSASGLEAPSNGEMRMKVKVENNNGVLKFTIDRVTYLDSDHSNPNNVYKNEAGIVMSGTEFSLGAFINKVTLDKAKLSVTKEIYIDGTKVAADDARIRDAEFKYYLKKGNQYVQDSNGTLGGTPHVFTIKNGNTHHFANLNLGEYVVEEITPGHLTGLDFTGNSVTYAGATANGTTVTLAKDDNASATIKNEYKTVSHTTDYSLKIKKDVKGLVGPSYDSKEYRISVKNTDTGMYVQSLNGTMDYSEYYFTVKKGKTLEIINIPAGNYSINEDTRDAQVQDYDLTVTIDKPTVTLSDADKNADVKVTNEYVKQTGKLKISKTFDSSTAITNTDGLKFIVTGPDNFRKEIKYSDFTNGEYTVTKDVPGGTTDELPVGVYSVTEVGAEGCTPAGYVYVGTTSGVNTDNPLDRSTECSVTVRKDTESTVSFKNTYEEQKFYDLTVNKSVMTEGQVDGIPDNFEIAIVNEDGKYYDPANSTDTDPVFVNAETYITVAKYGSYTARHLPTGKYKVVEKRSGAEISGAMLYVSGEGTYVLDTHNVEATVTNTYTKYSLTFTKTTTNSPYTGNTYLIAAKKEDGSFLQADGSMDRREHYFEVPANGSLTVPVRQPGNYEIFEKTENKSENNFYTLVTTYKVVVGGDGSVISAPTHPFVLIDLQNGGVANAEVNVTNAYSRNPDKGYIKLTKTITGLNNENVSGMTFTVKDADGNTIATKKLEDFTLTNGVYTLNEVIEVPDSSKTYTIEESANTVTGYDVPTVKYTVGSTSGDGATATVNTVSTDSSKPTTVAFTNNYKKQTTQGYLTLTKTIKGDVTDEDLSGLTFTVKDGNDVIKTFTLKDDFVKVEGSGEGTRGIYKLKDTSLIVVDDSSKTYTVEETLHTLTGFDVTETYKIGSTTGDGTEASVTGVSTDSTKPTTVEYTNEYKKQVTKGYITLTKTIKGDVTEEDLSGLTFTVKDGNTVIATLKLGEDFVKVEGSGEGTKGIYKLKDTSLIEVKDSSKTYTVEETLHTLTGFDVTETYKIGSTTGDGTEASVTGVSTDSTKPTTVEYTNDYTKKVTKGYITLTKTITGLNNENVSGMTFTVKDSAGKTVATKTLADFTLENGVYTLNEAIEVPDSTATYTVVESANTVTGYEEPTVTYTVGSTNGTGATATVATASTDSTKPTTVAFTNAYTKKVTKGYITLTKTIKGDVTEEDLSGLKFTVKVGNDVIATYTLGEHFEKVANSGEGTKGTYKLKEKYLLEVTDSSKTYTVVETLHKLTGFDVTETYKIGSTTGTGAEASVTGVSTDKTKPTTVEYTNDYELKTGSLTLIKSLINPDGCTTDTFTFYVKGENGKWYDKDGKTYDKETGITVKAGAANAVTISKIPVQKYSIYEKEPEKLAKTNYELDGSQSDPKKDDVQIEKDAEKKITLTNAYKTKEVETGSLTLIKSLINSEGCTTDTFTFYVKGADGKWYDKDGKTYDKETGITIKAGAANAVTISKIPVQTYSIYEKEPEKLAANGYEIDGSLADTSKSDVQIEKNAEKSITLTNAYKTKVVETGSLTLIKSLINSEGCTTDTFTFYVKGADGKWYDKDGKTYDKETGITVKAGTANAVTISKIPVQKYSVYEKEPEKLAANGYEIDGSQTDSSNDNVNVTKDYNTPVTLKNAYKTKEVDTGSLTLTKTLINPDGCTTDTFTFYVKGENGKWYDKDGKAHDKETGITVKAGDANAVTISKIPVQKYTVTEADPTKLAKDNFVLDSDESETVKTNVAVSKDAETSATLKNAYKKASAVETGSIKVSKVVKGAPEGTSTSYSFYVKCGSNYLKADGTFGDKSTAKQFEVQSGKETEVTGLELGKTYTIEEVSFNVPDGYTVSITYTSSKSVTLDSTNKSDSVTITNTYVHKGAPLAGSLVVTKRIAGSVPSSGMPDKYKFYVKCGDQYVQNDGSLGENKHLFEIAPNKSLTIIGLDTDNKTYQVVEVPVSNSDDLPDGYKWSVSYSSESVTLKDADDSGDIVITNNYTHKAPSPSTDKGNLELKKTVSGPSGCTKTTSFTFYVKGADKKWYDKNGTAHTDKVEVTVKAGETVTISNIPVQTYTITEKDPADTAADGFVIDGNKTVPSRVNVEVLKDETGTAELINVYKTKEVDKGNLILKKVVNGDNGCTKTDEFTFFVKGADNYWYDASGNKHSNKTPITVKGNDADGVKIEGIPVQKYDITEADPADAAADNYVVYGAGTDNVKTGVEVIKDKDTTVKLTNAYIKKTAPETGTLILKKTLNGDSGCTTTNEFTFYVKGEDNYWYDASGDKHSNQTPITVKGNDANGVKIEGIPVQKYDITEADPKGLAASKYEFVSGESTTSRSGVSVTAGKPVEAVLINTYKEKTAPETGTLILKKTLNGDSGCTTTNEFTFYVKGEDNYWYDASGDKHSNQTPITVKGNDANGVKIEGIPVQKYDITEADPKGLAASKYEFVSGESTTSRSGVSVTAGKPVEAVLINTYKEKTVPDTGKLSFTKTFGGDVLENEVKAATDMYFLIERTDTSDAAKYLKADGTFTSNAADARIKISDLDHVAGSLVWSLEIDNVPAGTYKVTEYNTTVKVSGSNNISFVLDKNSSVPSASTSVSKTTDGSLGLKNTYKLPGYDVKISKQDIAKNEIPKATLTLTSLNSYDLSGVTVKQGSKTIKVTLSKDKKSISFVTGTTPSVVTGLKPGTYELKETVTPEAYLTADAIKIIIDRNGTIRDGNGTIIVTGSPIVMIDRADPNYKKKNSVPATGVGTSPTNVIGAAVLAIGAVCCAGIVIYQLRKKRYR